MDGSSDIAFEDSTEEGEFVDAAILNVLDSTWAKYDTDGDGLLTIEEAKKLANEALGNL
jgi:hypothetical protein